MKRRQDEESYWIRLRRAEIYMEKLSRPRKVKLCGFVGSFSPPGFRVTIFFPAVFFRVTHDGLSERGINRSLYI